ncbi:MAG: GntR family transcriptional regulator [Dongiaceae bacterium]
MSSKPRPGLRLSRYSAPERFAILYRELRNRICFLIYPPGARLSETVLAAEFGVSRTPIRRVLGRLEAEGMIETSQGAATVVTDVDWTSLADLFELRARLSELAGRIGFRKATARDLREMQAVRAALARLARKPDPRRYAELNLRFHRAYTGLIPNKPLREFIELLYAQTNRIWLKELPFIDWQEEIGLFNRQVGLIAGAMRRNDSTAIARTESAIIRTSFDRVRKYRKSRKM